MKKISLEQLEEMQKDLFKKQCDLDIQKAFVKHFIKKKQIEQLTLTDVVVSEAECCDICKEESMKGNKVNKICTNCIKENY